MRLLFLTNLIVLSWARSFGLRLASDSYACDLMTAKYGCYTGWQYDMTTRTGCNDAVRPSMWWAASPTITNDFTLRTGEGDPSSDMTFYVPGERMPLYITCVKPGHFYEGLLMYAVDKNENKVGDWEPPDEENPEFIPHPVITCAKSVMHASATYKRRVAQFTYITPPAGTGDITFRVMWKDGQPNPTDHGGFLLPPKNLTLTEGTGPAPDWSVVRNGQDCALYCQGKGLSCVPALLGSPADLPAFRRIYGCDRAVFSECVSPGARVVDDKYRLCSYPETNCSGQGRANQVLSCLTPSSDANPLFCRCFPKGTEGEQIAPAGRAVPVWTLLIALCGLSMRRSHVFALVLFGGLMSTAQAHNWIEGPRGRAGTLQAATVQPALPPVHPLKIDAQVYIGQELMVEWATAHGGTTYLVVLSQSDEAKIDQHTFEMMDDYIALAPSNSYHGGSASTTGPFTKFARMATTNTPGSTYLALIANTSADYLGDRPSVWPTQLCSGGNCAGFQLSYPLTSIQTDARVSYVSQKYPWVEAVHRYTHVGSDVDAVRLTIPARRGAGRYLIHYLWSSYRDLYDIDVHTPPTPGAKVLNPYGSIPPPGTPAVYMQFDHCTFEDAGFLDFCVEAPTDAEMMRKKCDDEVRLQSPCFAYALTPVHGIPGPWQNYTPLPYGANGCNRTEFLALPPGSMASYTVRFYRNFNNGASPPWTIYKDPDYIGWWSTCYVKLTPLAWDLPITSLPLVPVVNTVPYRFGNKCIPCEDRGMDLSNGPRWRTADVCRDCDKEPAQKVRNTNLIPTVQSKQAGFFSNAQSCGGVNQNHSPCPNYKWVVLAGAQWMWEKECLVKAASDPECSKYVAWNPTAIDERWGLPYDYRMNCAGHNCACWLASAGALNASTIVLSGLWNISTLA